MATNLTIDTGLREYNLNGKVTVTFNPTDSIFIGKIYDTFSDLEEKEKEYKKQMENATAKEVLELSQQLNVEMRGILEDIFGVDVVTPLIGNANVYALAEGLPVWANILLAIIDELDDASVEEQAKTNARIAYYTKKYQVRDHKRKGSK